MIHLSISAKGVSDIGKLARWLRDTYQLVPVRLSLHVKPNVAGSAYESLQRLVPDCRLIACWSESEAICGGCAAWSCEQCVWWPAGDDCELWPKPDWIYSIAGSESALREATGRAMVVSGSGYRMTDGFVLPNGHSYQAVDLPCGPIAFKQTAASSLVTHGGHVRRIACGAWQLAVGMAIGRRVCCYVAPDCGFAYPLPDMPSVSRSLAIARESRWKSRIS